MILQALTRYYDILTNDPNSGVAPVGYSSIGISFALNLSLQGELLDVIPVFETVQRGKKTVQKPQRMLVLEQVTRTGNISPNLLWDNGGYVLGISSKGDDDPKYCKMRFDAFKQHNVKFLQRLDCDEARAVMAFLNSYNLLTGREHPAIAPHLEEILKGGNLVFKLEGRRGYVHEAPEIKKAWASQQMQTIGSGFTGQCLVTGKIAPIERLHAPAKNIPGGKSTGSFLVSFNERAYESYNRIKGQGLNAPVSEKAAFAYTTALNYLLSPQNPHRKLSVGDATVVYWAESSSPVYAETFEGLFYTEEIEQEKPERDLSAEHLLKDIAAKVSQLKPIDLGGLQKALDVQTRFYVLGLAPNSARLSVRFFHADPFIKVVEKIIRHYEDMKIEKEYSNQPDMIPLWQILGETFSKKAQDKKAPPLMAGAMMQAILGNTPYPAALYYAVITRIRADMDDDKARIQKINYVRAAIIKAYLTRKYRHLNNSKVQEVLCMSLNPQATHPAYLMGRLFAVLEKAQQEAAFPVKLNATIKDRYFTSACATPASVFPVLLRLSQHHISKAKYGYTLDARIEEIMGLLDVEDHPFPARLTLDEQGIFVLGYYHQRTAFYQTKKSDESTENQ